MRPFEAVLSFKSLFEGVLDHRLSSYFTWLALFTPRFSWAYFWGQNGEKKWGHWRPMEAAWGHLRPFEAKVKLWVSKFIFFHADSGNGLKHFLNKKVFGLGKRAFGGLSWPLLKCSFQDTYWATYTCLIGMNKLYLGSKNFLLTTSILESASNIIFGLSRDRSRPFRHLKFC